MFLALTSLCILTLSGASSVWRRNADPSDPTAFKEQFFKTDIDHFNGNDGRSFNLRFLVPCDQQPLTNNTYDAIFLYTGNEGNIEDFWKISGFVRESAQRHNAAIMFAEHRYYGKSFPFVDQRNPKDARQSFTGENIRYLTVEQTLADYAALIAHMQSDDRKLPVIAFGGSYGGWLSAWLRMKYPHLCAGAVAASANLALAAGRLDPHAYFSGGDQNSCFDRLFTYHLFGIG